MAGGQEKKLGTASQVLTQDLYIPNNVAAAVDYMEEHLYDNTLVVEIKKDVEDMKVGLKNTKWFLPTGLCSIILAFSITEVT